MESNVIYLSNYRQPETFTEWLQRKVLACRNVTELAELMALLKEAA